MCLSIVSKGPDPEAKGLGYKLIAEYVGRFVGPYQYYPYDMVGWNIDTSEYRLLNSYQSGFHVYDKLDSARYELAQVFLGQCQIWEVECRILRASGMQYGVPVSVWKEMRFIREVSLYTLPVLRNETCA